MATKTPLLPGYPISEYMLILSPDEYLQERIGKIKQAIIEKSGAKLPMGRSNVLLARWEAWDMQEDRLMRHLQILGMEQYPFQVHLENFSGFPSHTIYIPVTSREPITKLVAKVRKHKRLMQSPGKDAYFISEPALALFKGLTAGQYEQTMPAFEARQFHASFVADGMLLLKKKAGSQAFQIVKRFAFEHLAVTARQGALFV